MTPVPQVLFYYLWIAPRVLQILILVVLVKRVLAGKFPVFAAYTVFSIFKFAALLFVSRSSSTQQGYFKWYALVLGIYSAFRFGVVNEVFSHVFASYHALQSLKRPFFRWTTAAMLAIAFSVAAYADPSWTESTWFNVHVLESSANIVLCGLILSLLVISNYLNLAWTRVDFGIILGFGILCSCELALAAVRSRVGLSAHLAIDLVDMAAFHGCVLIWLFYLLSPERKREQAPDAVPHTDLEVWNRELDQLLQQ